MQDTVCPWYHSTTRWWECSVKRCVDGGLPFLFWFLDRALRMFSYFLLRKYDRYIASIIDGAGDLGAYTYRLAPFWCSSCRCICPD